jgi:hypothetical protein
MMARFICGILSIYVTAHVVKADMMAWSTLDVRHLQTSQTLNYRATYKADFQHLHDSDCSADKPILQISCYGTAMTILNRTDDTIMCTALSTPEIDNGMSYQCINTCTNCASVYEASGSIKEGPFASIIFMCEGDDIEQVNAKYSFTAGNPGSCDFTVATYSRNFHVAQLGVLCPADTGGRDYMYDDTYAECYIAGSATLSFVTDTANQTENDIYTCVTGNNCDGKTCSVPFDDIDIYATLPSFSSVCVETLADVGATPTKAPQVSTGNTATEYKVQYEASWGQVLGLDAVQQSCASANPSISVKCLAGSSIQYINSTDASMICTAVSESELSCSGDASAIMDKFTTVIYVSKYDQSSSHGGTQSLTIFTMCLLLYPRPVQG